MSTATRPYQRAWNDLTHVCHATERHQSLDRTRVEQLNCKIKSGNGNKLHQINKLKNTIFEKISQSYNVDHPDLLDRIDTSAYTATFSDNGKLELISGSNADDTITVDEDGTIDVSDNVVNIKGEVQEIWRLVMDIRESSATLAADQRGSNRTRRRHERRSSSPPFQSPPLQLRGTSEGRVAARAMFKPLQRFQGQQLADAFHKWQRGTTKEATMEQRHSWGARQLTRVTKAHRRKLLTSAWSKLQDYTLATQLAQERKRSHQLKAERDAGIAALELLATNSTYQ